MDFLHIFFKVQNAVSTKNFVVQLTSFGISNLDNQGSYSHFQLSNYPKKRERKEMQKFKAK